MSNKQFMDLMKSLIKEEIEKRQVLLETPTKKDIDKLIKSGVPYKRGKKPLVFVFDWHIIKKKPT